MKQMRMPVFLIFALMMALAFHAHAAGLPPEQAVKALHPAPGFEITLAASEPNSRQPVNIMFDQRGRLWVVQYLQYPYPAGLKIVSQDQYLRTIYDRVPEPPPKGPKGADRITILESSKDDGHFDRAKDFISGLNLASAMEIGYGGVWVAQTPYLLFYPDKNGDDVPDGPPQVVLSGFGMEDAHAVVNHLIWGPDGWLYGCQGSTNTANIEGHEFQQAAWRYNPRTKAIEVFSEGGGNTFGLDWDAHGSLFTGTNNSYYVMFHYVQGGYYLKNFGKHGELHNPYAFGYFDHVPHTGWRGGHVTQLGLIYQGGAFPKEFNGTWITPRLLDNRIEWNTMTPDGSSFHTKYAGDLVTSSDPRFRPVDLRTGPDGAIYIADWYDIRANHVIAVDDWDKETGRVYRLAPKGLAFYKPFDLAKLSSDQLVDLLDKPNDWYARTARRILADRRDASVIQRLRKQVIEKDGRLALQSLWALYVSGGFDDAFALQTLNHVNPDVRSWTVRLLCDEKSVSASIQQKLVELARSEPQVTVRMQLACSARRLPADQGMPIVHQLLMRSEDVSDRYVPLLLWWAIEDKANSGRDRVVEIFSDPKIWQSPIVKQVILERIGRRYTAERTEENFTTCARLLDRSPGQEQTDRLVAGMELGLHGTPLPQVPRALRAPLAKLWEKTPRSVTLVRLALRLGDHKAEGEAVRLAGSNSASASDRAAIVEILGQLGNPSDERVLLDLVDQKQPKAVRLAALVALQSYDDAKIATVVLGQYAGMSADLRDRARSLLSGRKSSASALLDAVESNRIARQDVSIDQIRQIMLHNDTQLDSRVKKLWGAVQPATSQEKQQMMAHVMEVLHGGTGDAHSGAPIFLQLCATCHTLRGQGGRIGPNLTAYDRKDLNFLVPNIVDPSASIRPEYAMYILRTTDRRVLNGPLIESNLQSVTIEDGTARVTVPRSQIFKLEASPTSRMPEHLLDALSDQQLRDLFAYIAAEK